MCSDQDTTSVSWMWIAAGGRGMAGQDDALVWRRSSRCGESGGCVDIARTTDHVIVRESGRSSGNRLAFPVAAWRAFVRDIGYGGFDHA
jgi:hypothetical protein